MVFLTRALTLSFLLGGAAAFAPSSVVNSRAPSTTTRIFMDGPKDGKKIASGRKEIGFDAASGRFFETGKTAEECIPEDEYCAVDQSTGELVRLTLAEKERMFLDCLQVRTTCM